MYDHYTFEADRVRTDGAYSGITASVWRWGRDGERWLSQKTPSLRDIRISCKAVAPATLGRGGIPAFLYPYQGIRKVTLLSFLLLSILLGIAALAAILFAPSSPNEYTNAANVLLPTAEVIGAVIGILIAVIVFAVQYHGESNRDASQLMRFLIRWEGFVLIAGLTLAFVGSQIIASIIGALWWEPIVYGMAAVDVIGVPIAIWLTIYLFHRMLNSVTADFFGQGVMPGLTYEFDRHLDIQSRWSAMNYRYYGILGNKPEADSELSKFNIRWSPYVGSLRDDLIPIGPKLSGVLVDVNLHQLKQLSDLLSAELPESILTCSSGLGNHLRDEHIYWIRHESMTTNQLSHTLRELAEQLNYHITRSTRLSKRSDDDLSSVLDTVVISAAEKIREGAWQEADRIVQIILRLHESRLDRPDSDFLNVDDINLTGFFRGKESVFELARAAGESGKPDTVDVVSKFAIQLAQSAMTHGRLPLFGESLELLRVMYYRLASSPSPSSSAIERMDTWFGSVSDIELMCSGGVAISSDRRRMYSKVAICGLLRATRDAIQLGRMQDTVDFHHRVVQIVEEDRYREDNNELDDEVVNFLSYGQILLVGWCLELVRKSVVNTELLNKLTEAVLKQSNRLHLHDPWMKAWETIDHGFRKAPFGEDHWVDSLRRWRTNVTYSGSPPTDWMFDGLILLMLKGPKSGRSRKIVAPLNTPEKAESVTEAIRRVFAADGVASTLFGNDSEMIDKAKMTVADVFGKRRMLKKKSDLVNAVTAPICNTLRRGTHENATVALRKNIPGWLSNNAHSRPIIATSIYRRDLNKPEIRECYVLNGRMIGNLGAHDGGHLARGDIASLEYTTLCIIDSAESVATNNELQEAIRKGCNKLRESGFNPDTLFLPHQSRFAMDLTGGLPRWQREGLDDSLLGQGGTWEGLNIYKFRCHEFASVLIADSKRLWGTHMQGDEGLSLELSENYTDQNAELLKKALDADNEEDVPRTEKVLLSEEWRLIPRFGLSEFAAGVKIPLDLSTFGYALPANDKHYHRPDCEVAKGCQDFSLVYCAEGETENRSACEKCKPDDWDSGREKDLH